MQNTKAIQTVMANIASGKEIRSAYDIVRNDRTIVQAVRFLLKVGMIYKDDDGRLKIAPKKAGVDLEEQQQILRSGGYKEVAEKYPKEFALPKKVIDCLIKKDQHLQEIKKRIERER